MANFNKVLLMGNLTRDPSLKYLPSQTAVCEFGIATNRKFKSGNGEDREEVTFVDVTAFGRQAEVINQYCSRGKPIFIEGRLKYDQWEDKQSGGKRSRLTVVVESFQLMGGVPPGQESERGGGQGDHPPRESRQSAPRQQRQAPTGNQQEPPFGDEPQFNGDDDIPF